MLVAAVAFVVVSERRDAVATAENYPVLMENLPTMVRIDTLGGVRRCSGSAVGTDTVITSAHCIKDASAVTVIQEGVEFEAREWRENPSARDGEVEGDLAYIKVREELKPENHSDVPVGSYDLRAWVTDGRGVTVRGCLVSEKMQKHGGHYHVRCPLGKGASGAGLWFKDSENKWTLVGVVSQYDNGVVSIADVE